MALVLWSVPFAVPAQAPKAVRVGVFAGGGPGFDGGFEPFRQRLRELGYGEGKNLVLEVRNAQGRAERYQPLAGELVGLGSDVIVVQGNAALYVLKQATQTIPIVMANIGDPVGAGFVASLTRPGGNITGLSNMAEGVSAKWVQLLREAAPRTARIAVLWDPKNVAHRSMWKEVEEAGRALAISTQAFEVRGRDDVTRAFATIAAGKIDALIILPQPAAGANLQHITQLAATQRLPAVYLSKEFALAGGLMSYGPSVAEMWRRAADYVDRIAKGAKAADLPVDQPTKFALVINRKAATALGLTLPPSLVLRADEMIE
ncbi:MAG TPA: ABC transporter substrate-binding protein [Burkholderiales bacterium]|nr:ABC transporter substrate-binding protein [Burkholderiales bacterium]